MDSRREERTARPPAGYGFQARPRRCGNSCLTPLLKLQAAGFFSLVL
nr:MAG TPA: hypothetical protein [Bacteriophage sp.]